MGKTEKPFEGRAGQSKGYEKAGPGNLDFFIYR